MTGTPGSQKLTNQGYLSPPNAATRVYHINYVATTSPTNLKLGNNEESSTATGSLATWVQVDATTLTGQLDSSAGILFPLGVLLVTSSDFAYAIITFSTEK